MNQTILYAFIATIGTWFMTALGAGTVVFFKQPKKKVMNLMLGFAAGVMIAASFWSLLLPAVTRAEGGRIPEYIVVVVGFIAGAIFVWVSDKILSMAIAKAKAENKCVKSNRIAMLILSITLHNIPEGLAVGVAFGVLERVGMNAESIMGAAVIAIGVAIQNFPEGAAVSLPLRREGYTRGKSFFLGQASGMVEPIAGVIGAATVIHIQSILPFALSFAAGAMILVAVHELIPECQSEKNKLPYLATMGIIGGFAVMTWLDIMLG